MTNENTVPLISSQRWKFWLFGAAVCAIGACYLFPERLAGALGMEPALFVVSATLSGLVVLIGAWTFIQCPACGLRLVWYAMSKKPASDWLVWLWHVDVCPRCNHSEHPPG